MEDLSDAIPSFLVFVAVLAAHEIGHLAAAKKAGLQLGPPFFIPSLQVHLNLFKSPDIHLIVCPVISFRSFKLSPPFKDLFASFLTLSLPDLPPFLPYFPSFNPKKLGSFGAITPIQGLIKTRQQLAEVATAGPLAGAVVGVSLLLIGLLLPAGEDAVIVQSTAFHDSVFVGLLG